MFKIEQNVKMTNRRGSNRQFDYPVEQMEAGDSILLPYDHLNLQAPQDGLEKAQAEAKARSRIRGSAISKGFSDRTYSAQSEEGGVRVWFNGIGKKRNKKAEVSEHAPQSCKEHEYDNEFDEDDEE